MLATGGPIFQVKRFSLGPELNQCCGGNVQMMFETVGASSACWLRRWAELAASNEPWSLVTGFDGAAITKSFIGPGQPANDRLPAAVRQQMARRTAALIRTDLAGTAGECIYYIEPNGPPASEIFLFGAGHVGRAIVRQFEHLPFHLTWIDSRADEFPAALPGNVIRLIAPLPPTIVDQAPADVIYLIMTHSHPLDLDICARILRRRDFRFLGLIGSETKRARFANRLRAIGIPDHDLSRLTCPIGLPGIGGKEPAAIAVAVAAQLLLIDNAAQRQSAPRTAAQAGR
jgi:xanthine dehydrogenase accessory factor